MHLSSMSMVINFSSEFKFKYLRLLVNWIEFSLFDPYLDVYISAYIEQLT
jgi:hypothetical protein